MFFHVRDLEVRKAHFDVALEPGAIEFFDPKLKQAGNLVAKGTAELVEHSLGGIRVRGHLNVAMTSECDRCLEPAVFPIDCTIDVEYRPMPKEFSPNEVEVDRGESEIAFYSGDGLELNDVLSEQILLTVPMQRVCIAECRGICPVCGENRNYVACTCREQAMDDRWAALKHLSH